MLYVFLGLMLSLLAFSVNAGLSNEKLNCVICPNTFLKEMLVVAPALITNGPWGLGTRQCPWSGMV